MKIWKIYKHTCKINGKSYIGQTCQTKLEQRWRSGNGYKNNKLFYNAIQKYGWENFIHEVIETDITTLAQANDRERYWILKFHTWKYDPDCNGYNLTPGGDAVEGARLMSNEFETVKVSPLDIEKYLALGYMFHDSIEYRPIKHRKWYAEHKDEQNKRTKKYYIEHKEKFSEINKANCKKYYQDPEFKAKKKAYRLTHPEMEKEISKRAQEKRKLDPEYKRKHAEANKRWAEKKKKEGSK